MDNLKGKIKYWAKTVIEFLLKLLFPNDKKTLEKLHNIKEKAKEEIKKLKIKRKEKKDHQDK